MSESDSIIPVISVISVVIGGLLSLLGSYLAVSYGAKKALQKEYLLKSFDMMEKLELRENLYDVLWEETSKIKKSEDLSLEYVVHLCDTIEKIMETKKLMLYCPFSYEINELYTSLVNLNIDNESERKKIYKKIKKLTNHIETVITYITYSPKKFSRWNRLKIWLTKD